MFEVVRRLDRRRFDVRVCALRGGAVADWLTAASVPTTALDVRGKWDLAKLAKLIGLLRSWRPDILHTHLFHADLVGRIAAAWVGVPQVIHTIQTAERRFRPWQFAFARLAAGGCDTMIAVSPSARDFHARKSGLPLHRYEVIPNGLDAAAYGRDPEARRRLREKWGLVEGEILAAFVGRLAPEKGLGTLLEAMRQLYQRGAAPRLLLAGEGSQRAMIEQFISHEPAGRCVRLLGFTSDVRGVLSAADFLVMPSRWEGFGLAAAEAMAAELPVLASHVEGLKDVVEDGRTGLLLPKNDPTAWADAIACLKEDSALRRRLGAAGRRRVKERFNISDIVAAHEALYLHVASLRRQRLD